MACGFLFLQQHIGDDLTADLMQIPFDKSAYPKERWRVQTINTRVTDIDFRPKAPTTNFDHGGNDYPIGFTPLGKAPPIGPVRKENFLKKNFADYFTSFDGKYTGRSMTLKLSM